MFVMRRLLLVFVLVVSTCGSLLQAQTSLSSFVSFSPSSWSVDDDASPLYSLKLSIDFSSSSRRATDLFFVYGERCHRSQELLRIGVERFWFVRRPFFSSAGVEQVWSQSSSDASVRWGNGLFVSVGLGRKRSSFFFSVGGEVLSLFPSDRHSSWSWSGVFFLSAGFRF